MGLFKLAIRSLFNLSAIYTEGFLQDSKGVSAEITETLLDMPLMTGQAPLSHFHLTVQSIPQFDLHKEQVRKRNGKE